MLNEQTKDMPILCRQNLGKLQVSLPQGFGRLVGEFLMVAALLIVGINRASAQLYNRDFSSDPGWTVSKLECGPTDGTIGISSGEFIWRDVEGDCCDGPNESSTGRNNSSVTTDLINLQGACSFIISFSYRWEGDLECYNPAINPLTDGCQEANGGGIPSGQDQFVFQYRLDGGDWVTFFRFCENGEGSRSFQSDVINRANNANIEIRIIGGVQAVNEIFAIDDFMLNDAGGGRDLNLQSYELCTDEPALALPEQIEGISGIWTDGTGTVITELDPTALGVGQQTISFQPMGACTNQAVYTTTVEVRNCDCPLYSVRLVRNECLDPQDINNKDSYFQDIEFEVIGRQGGSFEWFLLDADSVTWDGRRTAGGNYNGLITLNQVKSFFGDEPNRAVLLVIDESTPSSCPNGSDSIFVQIPLLDESTNDLCQVPVTTEIGSIRCNNGGTENEGDDRLEVELSIFRQGIQGSCRLEVIDQGTMMPLAVMPSEINFEELTTISIDLGSNPIARPQLRAFDEAGNIIPLDGANVAVDIANPNLLLFDGDTFIGVDTTIRCDTTGVEDTVVFDLAVTGLYSSLIPESGEVFNGSYRLNLITPGIDWVNQVDQLPLTEVTDFANPAYSQIVLASNGQSMPSKIQLSVTNDSIGSCEKIFTISSSCPGSGEMEPTDTSSMPPTDTSIVGDCGDTFVLSDLMHTCASSGSAELLVLVGDTATVLSPDRLPSAGALIGHLDQVSSEGRDSLFFSFFDLYPGTYGIVARHSTGCRDTFTFEIEDLNAGALDFEPTYRIDCDSVYYEFNYTGNSTNAEFLLLTNFEQDTVVVDSSGAIAFAAPYSLSLMVRDSATDCFTEPVRLRDGSDRVYPRPYYEFDSMPTISCVTTQMGDQKQLNFSVSPIDDDAPFDSLFRIYSSLGEVDGLFHLRDNPFSITVPPSFLSDSLYLEDTNGCAIIIEIDTSTPCAVSCELLVNMDGAPSFDCENAGEAYFSIRGQVGNNLFVFVNDELWPDSLYSYMSDGIDSFLVVTGMDTGLNNVVFSLDPRRQCADTQRVTFAPPSSAFDILVNQSFDCHVWTASIDVLLSLGNMSSSFIYYRVDNLGNHQLRKEASGMSLFDTIDFQYAKEPDSLFLMIIDTSRFCRDTVVDTIVFDPPKRLNFDGEPTLGCGGGTVVLSFAVDTVGTLADSFLLLLADSSWAARFDFDDTTAFNVGIDSTLLANAGQVILSTFDGTCQDIYDVGEIPFCDPSCGLMVDKATTEVRCADAKAGNFKWTYEIDLAGVTNDNAGPSNGFWLVWPTDSIQITYGVPAYEEISGDVVQGDVIYFRDIDNPSCFDSIIVGPLDDCCETVVYPSINPRVVDDTCAMANGSIDFGDAINVTTGHWTVDWNVDRWDGQRKADSLIAGIYTATLMNNIGCKDSTYTIVVGEVSNLNASATILAHPTAVGAMDGSISVSCQDCSLPYTLIFNGMLISMNRRDTVFENLGEGAYAIMVEDNSVNCRDSFNLVLDADFCDDARASIVLIEGQPVTEAGAYMDGQLIISCGACLNDRFIVFVDGDSVGVGMDGMFVVTGLDSTVHDIRIVFDRHCDLDTTFQPTVCPTYPTALVVEQPQCNGSSTGSIALINLPPNRVIRFNGQVTEDTLFTGLRSDDYTIEVEDTVLADACYPGYRQSVYIGSTFNYNLGINPNVTIRAGESVTLRANDPGIVDFDDYYWALNGVPICTAPCLEVTVSPNQETTYEFVINSDLACGGPFGVNVSIIDPAAPIVVPNAFDDGANSRFIIIDQGINIQEIEEFSVFDRYGAKLYYLQGLPGDGNLEIDLRLDFNGAERFMANTVYTYYIKAKLYSGFTQNITGTFIIIR